MEEPRARRWCLAFLLLALLLAGLFLWSLNAGSLPLTPGEVWDILVRREGEYAAVIWKLRLPRTLAAALLGGALSVSGFLLQAFFANPIASPFVLGISSGAKLTVSLAMVGLLSRGVVMSSGGMILAAFAGAMLSMGFVLLLSKWLHQMSLLVVSGVMIGYLCSAVTEFVVTFASDANIVNLHNWSMGSFSGVSWANLRVLLPVIGAALVGSFLLSKPMGAYQLGEGCARSMGVNIRAFRTALILLSSVLFSFVEVTNTFARMGLHLLLLPVIVSLTYELNRVVGRYDNRLTRLVSAPGMWLQNWTTFEPDDSMIEVGIKALELVLPEVKGEDAW